jgi:predicted DCC family thiol-disulfide oxidoreductase YuxK
MLDTIIYFDGECIMCNHSIKFVIKRDKKYIFKIGYTKSLESKNQDSIVLFYNGLTYKYSSAVIKCLILLGGFYKMAYIFYIIPKWLRDPVYKFIANNRYKWFGKHYECPIPPKEWKDRMKSPSDKQ